MCIRDRQDTDGDGAFTLRYDAGKYSKNLGSAVISYDESKVILTDVPNGTYLVAQNSNGAYAKQITNETEVSASGMNLDNFANCKIWLETTDTANRITYAALAEKEQETAVNIVAVSYTHLDVYKRQLVNCEIFEKYLETFRIA